MKIQALNSDNKICEYTITQAIEYSDSRIETNWERTKSLMFSENEHDVLLNKIEELDEKIKSISSFIDNFSSLLLNKGLVLESEMLDVLKNSFGNDIISLTK